MLPFLSMSKLRRMAAPVLLIGLASPLFLMATDSPAAPDEQEQAQAALWALWREGPADPDLLQNDPKGYYQWTDGKMQRFATAVRDYAASYPHDPRRYNGLIQSSFTRPWFIVGFKPEFDAAPGERNLIVDQTALNDFRRTQLKFLADVIEAPDATSRQRGGAMYAYLIDGRADARDRGVPHDLVAVGALVERAMTQSPDESILPVVEQYLTVLKQERPDEVGAFEAKVQDLPQLAQAVAGSNARREAAAAERAEKLSALSTMKFTAIDGREVDLAAMRGKVVLVDFWATWCGPCIAELPHLKKVYAAYHDRGFEIIGITLENARLTPSDTPEQEAAKLARARHVLTSFTEKNDLPWPQHFDGRFWRNEFAAAFGIESIPAMFLLDQEGRLVTTDARGEKLETEVKRLLNL